MPDVNDDYVATGDESTDTTEPRSIDQNEWMTLVYTALQEMNDNVGHVLTELRELRSTVSWMRQTLGVKPPPKKSAKKKAKR